MAVNTSGVWRLDLTAEELIAEALYLLQVIGQGETLSGAQYQRAINRLNRMLKAWEGQGIHLWTQTEGTMFLRVGQAEFDFNNTGKDPEGATWTHLTNTWYQTSLTAPLEIGTDPDQLTLDSVANLAPGSLVGVVNQNGDLEWRRAYSIAGNVVQFETAFTVDAAGSSVVYHYRYDEATTGSAVGATQSFTPADISLFQVGDTVLYELDAGGFQRNTVTAVGATELTLLTAVTSAVTAKNIIVLAARAYDWSPIKRLVDDGIRRREDSDYEIPIEDASRKDYFNLPNKNQRGTVIQAYYSRQEPYGVMYVWLTPDRCEQVVNFTYERSIQVVTQQSQTVDIPEDWYDAVVTNLAVRLIPIFGCAQNRKMDVKQEAIDSLDLALAMDQDVYSIRLVPEQHG